MISKGDESANMADNMKSHRMDNLPGIRKEGLYKLETNPY